MRYDASVVGRFARDALADGHGEVCATFRRSFYLRLPGDRYACVGDESLGHGPLNALVAELRLPGLGSMISVSTRNASLWEAPGGTPVIPPLQDSEVPAEGLGCLLLGVHNPLAMHAQPALEALDDWL